MGLSPPVILSVASLALLRRSHCILMGPTARLSAGRQRGGQGYRLSVSSGDNFVDILDTSLGYHIVGPLDLTPLLCSHCIWMGPTARLSAGGQKGGQGVRSYQEGIASVERRCRCILIEPTARLSAGRRRGGGGAWGKGADTIRKPCQGVCLLPPWPSSAAPTASE